MRYWSTEPHRTREQTRAWLADMAALTPEAGEDFVVELEGRAVGKCGFWRWPEIGFLLAPDVWGRGLGREAATAVLARGFAVHRLDRAVADVDPRNAASLALLARLGFRETGRAARTFRVGGEWSDSVYLAVDRAGFEAARGA
jgi:RimJ/RimL family protein N-acetyltransferase